MRYWTGARVMMRASFMCYLLEEFTIDAQLQALRSWRRRLPSAACVLGY